MKINHYVAIHCWKALSLRIGQHSKFFKNINLLLCILLIKFTAFTRYFTFKLLASAQFLASSCKTLWKFHVLILTVHWFFHAKYFQSGMLMKKPSGHIFMHVPCFESVMHGEISARFICGYRTFQVLDLWCSTLWKWNTYWTPGN